MTPHMFHRRMLTYLDRKAVYFTGPCEELRDHMRIEFTHLLRQNQVPVAVATDEATFIRLLHLGVPKGHTVVYAGPLAKQKRRYKQWLTTTNANRLVYSHESVEDQHAKGVAVECELDYFRRRAIRPFIQGWVNALGVTVAGGAIDAVADYPFESAGELINLIRLLSLAPSDTEVTADTMSGLLSDRTHTSLFDIIGAMLSMDYAKLLTIAELKGPPFLYAIADLAFQVFVYAGMRLDKTDSDRIFAILHRSEFFLKKFDLLLDTFKLPQLRRLIFESLQADRAVHSGKSELREALNGLVQIATSRRA